MGKFRRIGGGFLIAAVLGITVPGCGNDAVSDSPQVLNITPDEGGMAVPLNANVIVTFDLPMDAVTIEGTTNFSLLKESTAFSPAGALTYNDSTFKAVFDPTLNLEPETLYRVTLTRGIRGENGEALVREYTWTFRTGAAPLNVIATRPLEGAVSVALNGNVMAVFNDAMDPATMTAETVTLEGPGGAAVSGTVSYNESTRTVTFDPSSDLATETTYLVRLTTGIKDLVGNPLVREVTFSFMTGADYPVDNVPPSFAGAVSAVADGSDAIMLTWVAATDNLIPESEIVYLIFGAEASGAEDYTTPTYTTAPGDTAYTATGLTGNTEYFFVVAARDRSGNISQTIVERSTFTEP